MTLAVAVVLVVVFAGALTDTCTCFARQAHVEKIKALFSKLGADKTGVITYAMPASQTWMQPELSFERGCELVVVVSCFLQHQISGRPDTSIGFPDGTPCFCGRLTRNAKLEIEQRLPQLAPRLQALRWAAMHLISLTHHVQLSFGGFVHISNSWPCCKAKLF